VRQLRPFAKHIRDGAYFDRRHDAVLPDRVALPWPDLKLVQRPIGPVAVFGASNFLPAFSVAGKDLAAALTEGWPVQWCVAVLPPRAPISEPPAGT
jgi:NADP-dependent aldehyde dehydrogenase